MRSADASRDGLSPLEEGGEDSDSCFPRAEELPKYLIVTGIAVGLVSLAAVYGAVRMIYSPSDAKPTSSYQTPSQSSR